MSLVRKPTLIEKKIPVNRADRSQEGVAALHDVSENKWVSCLW
jgi:hypothetical protein